MAHVPNLISLARLGAVPVVIWCVLAGHNAAAFWVFLAAGLSDALDGMIAKRFKVTSRFGAWLDPLADKALLVGTYVALTLRDALPMWLTILVVFRDALIVGGALTVQALTQRFSVEPMMISKVNTALQIGLVVMVMAERAYFALPAQIVFVGALLVAVTTVLSGATYVVTWSRRVTAWERESAEQEHPQE
ncbi:MAG: CDP-alcohol phosphatidyltransferase family protein [Alphaproteobacteria bacterium]|nr:CDP-alcohol phosphatidyltransferase family protein [Alphaproteobacteria bacterium]